MADAAPPASDGGSRVAKTLHSSSPIPEAEDGVGIDSLSVTDSAGLVLQAMARHQGVDVHVSGLRDLADLAEQGPGNTMTQFALILISFLFEYFFFGSFRFQLFR